MPRHKKVLSGLGAARKKRRKKTAKKTGCKRVPRSQATHRSGKKKGKLKKGYRFLKKDGACKIIGATTTRRKGRKKARGKTTRKKKVHSYTLSSSLVWKKGKGGKKGK